MPAKEKEEEKNLMLVPLYELFFFYDFIFTRMAFSSCRVAFYPLFWP